MGDDKQELKMTCPKCGQHVFCPTCLGEVDKQERSCEDCNYAEGICTRRRPCSTAAKEYYKPRMTEAQSRARKAGKPTRGFQVAADTNAVLGIAPALDSHKKQNRSCENCKGEGRPDCEEGYKGGYNLQGESECQNWQPKDGGKHA